MLYKITDRCYVNVDKIVGVTVNMVGIVSLHLEEDIIIDVPVLSIDEVIERLKYIKNGFCKGF